MRTELKFLVGVVIGHVATYLAAGLLAQILLGAGVYYPPSPDAVSYLRDPRSAYVMTWILPAQILRGALIGLVLLPFRRKLLRMGQVKGGLAIAAVVFVIGFVAASGGLIEHLVFFAEYPPAFAAITTVEVAIQALLFGQFVLWWENRFNTEAY